MDAVDASEIINCPQCGTRNRVGAYSSFLRPVCGRCHASLVSVIAVERGQPPASPKPDAIRHRTTKKRIKIAIGLLAVLAMGAWIAVLTVDQMDSAPTSDRSRPIAPPAPIASLASPAPPAYQRPLSYRRLDNGAIIRSAGLYGMGQLTIKNGGSLDAVAKLVSRQDETCKAFFYIAAQNEFTLPGIDDGYYRLLFGIGEDWDSATHSFTRNKAFSEFETPMVFTTRQEVRGRAIYDQYSVLEITLHPVFNGNVRTQSVSEQEFDKY